MDAALEWFEKDLIGNRTEVRGRTAGEGRVYVSVF